MVYVGSLFASFTAFSTLTHLPQLDQPHQCIWQYAELDLAQSSFVRDSRHGYIDIYDAHRHLRYTSAESQTLLKLACHSNDLKDGHATQLKASMKVESLHTDSKPACHSGLTAHVS